MLTTPISFSSLIAVMFIGIGLQKKRGEAARRISVKYGKLWVAAEIFLFVLVGAAVVRDTWPRPEGVRFW